MIPFGFGINYQGLLQLRSNKGCPASIITLLGQPLFYGAFTVTKNITFPLTSLKLPAGLPS
jgi:hypothetical protein